MSSPAQDYAGGNGEQQVFFLPHHHNQHAGDSDFFYHVPQHSRREKLRFPTEDSPAATTSSLPPFYQASAATALANLLPSSYYNVPSVADSGAHQVGNGVSLHQIHPQGFSLSLSPAEASPLGPFTGYADVLNRSWFVEPARQLLEEICQFGRGNFAGCRDQPEDFTLEAVVEKLSGAEGQQWKRIKLVSMLDEVYRKYRLYYQQVETVTASFETVAGLKAAAPYISIALKSLCRNFSSLKNVISGHLTNLHKDSGKGLEKREISGFGLRATGYQACSQIRNYGTITFGQQHVWRPQRGLPERAVVVLRAWLFEHFLHPYPTDTDKQMLAKQTGLTRNQVSNWFINARVRLWKPMVEEIHNLELHQSQKAVTDENNNVQNADFKALQPSTSAQDICTQRSYNQPRDNNKPSHAELSHTDEPYNFVFNDFAGHGQTIGGNSIVSLTLGLRQNNGTVCLPEPLSVNVARHLTLEECSNAYVLGGQLLRDFVG